MLTDNFVMERHAEKMQLPSNEFCHGCESVEEEETVIHFLCQSPSLGRCRYRLFGSPILISLMELSSIGVKDIALLINPSKKIVTKMKNQDIAVLLLHRLTLKL